MTTTQHVVSSLLVAVFTAGIMVAAQSIAGDASKSEKVKCITAHDINKMTQEEFDRVYNTGG